ncbi:hypothetical protein [Acidiphilium iwatense]|uniref:Type II secretion system protein GspC N-terminal domain-containing protein n=1 Tax=Acidiphilium iwatense TaxID=768198 RepID=A0ABS9DWG0_9PROT|nr:hypothetical protein [Acidiphilium iwatense]MCF3945777.1 hypothetical protein [Acidiphilium iwatense]
MTRFPTLLPRHDAVIAGALAGIAALIWLAPIPRFSRSSQPSGSIPASPTIQTGTALPNIHQLETRPLFVKTRRPPPRSDQKPAAAIKTPKPLPSTSGMVLLGVLHSGSKSAALVILPGSAQPRQITPGAVLGDWVVKKILRDRLLLRSGHARAELVLPASVPGPLAPAPGFASEVPPLPQPSQAGR